ncbi:MAG TPA: 1,4-dihydroxy-2-naphthoate polyprenyltransferase [Acidimicrobiia bacterium]|nr:1,4-dihydroxy-2-naphthoate polyprenyltransferase [Acidimicrobiia bacterium]
MNAWLVAARPPTLLASVAPVVVGSGLAAGQEVFRWDAAIVTLATAVLLNIAVNFANDVSDAARGADTEHRIGPPRAVSGGLLAARQVWAGTAVILALACAGGIYLTAISGPLILGIGAAAIVALLAYTGGPWPYGYHGLGEVFVFVFFGPAAVVGSRYVHDATIPGEAWLLGAPVGFLATAILVANNLRDIETDRAAGKRTLAVILGRRGTRVLYAALVIGAFGVIGVIALLGLVSPWASVALAGLPLAVRPIRVIYRETGGPGLISALKATAGLHLLVGVLLGVGVAL